MEEGYESRREYIPMPRGYVNQIQESYGMDSSDLEDDYLEEYFTHGNGD